MSVGLLGLLGAGAGLLGNVIKSGIDWTIAGQNIGFSQSTNELNERLTREAWARDDTAIQRRVADLKEAGINPLYAITGASTTSPISMSAPKNDYKQSNPFDSVLSNILMSQQFASQDAQINESNAQANYYDALANRVNGQADNDVVSYVNQGMTYLQNLDDIFSAGRQNPSMIAKTIQSIPFLSDLATYFRSGFNADAANIAIGRIAEERSKLYRLYLGNIDTKLKALSPDKPVILGTEVRRDRNYNSNAPVITNRSITRDLSPYQWYWDFEYNRRH